MNICVLGSGMTGLLAAKAVHDVTGEVPEIQSDRVPHEIKWGKILGVHVLHDDCGLIVPEMFMTNSVVLPTLSSDEPELLAELSGWERKMANATYGQKVYGSRKAVTSLMRMPGVIEGYDYVEAFNILVAMYGVAVKTRRPVNENNMHDLCSTHDLVISSVPRHCITPSWVKHPFSVAFVSQRPPVGFAPAKELGDHFVVYNADPGVQWSRTARMKVRHNEVWTTEYNNVPSFHIPDLKQVEKIMQAEPFGFPENLLTVGRYGQWKPGVLAHDAYWQTVERLRVMGYDS